MRYHITIFDQFHRGDLDAAWDGGTYATAEAAIADAKSMIDYELKHFWEEEAREGPPTVDGLVSRYRCFAEMPVAFGPGNKVIFDSLGYAGERAAQMVADRTGAPTTDTQRPPPAVPTSIEPSRSAWSTSDVLGLLIVIILSLLLLLVFGPRR